VGRSQAGVIDLHQQEYNDTLTVIASLPSLPSEQLAFLASSLFGVGS